MALTKNGKRIGAAAYAERIDNMRYIIDAQAEYKKTLKEQTLDVCTELSAVMGEDYADWWQTAPDGNKEFFDAACDALLAIKTEEETDYCQTYISGGDVIEFSSIISNEEIPF